MYCGVQRDGSLYGVTLKAQGLSLNRNLLLSQFLVNRRCVTKALLWFFCGIQ